MEGQETLREPEMAAKREHLAEFCEREPSRSAVRRRMRLARSPRQRTTSGKLCIPSGQQLRDRETAKQTSRIHVES